MDLFTINCLTCRRRLKVLDASAVGRIVACPKCGSMVSVRPPPGWQPPAVESSAIILDEGAPAIASTAVPSAPVDAEVGAAPFDAEILPVVGFSPLAWCGAALATCLLAIGGWWLMRPSPNDLLPEELPVAPAAAAPADPAPRVAARATSSDAEPEFEEIVLQVLDEQEEVDHAAVDGEQIPGHAAPLDAHSDEIEPELEPLQHASAAGEMVIHPNAADAEPETPAARRVSFSLRPVDVQARLQDRVARFRCRELPLRKFVDLVSQLSTVAITLDVDSIGDAGIPLDATVTLDQREASIAEILQAALEPLTLGYAIAGDQLVVEDARPDRALAGSQRHDVQAILSGDQSANDVARMVQRIVFPGAWQDDGGDGKMEIAAGALVVTHVPAAQRRIESLLDRWKSARLQSSGRATAGFFDGTAKTQLGLQQPCSLTFHRPTPLPRVLKQLEGTSDVRFLVDWRSLRAAGIPPTVEATVTAADQPLAVVLENLLRPMDAGYRIVAPDLLEIASRAELQLRHEVAFYPLDGLAANAAESQEIAGRLLAELSRLQETPSPAGVLSLDPASRAILAHQPYAVQLRIAALMDEWRAAAEKP